MPLYEYECESCGKKFDRIQKFSDPPVEKCEFCSGKVHKVLSAPVFIFKGSGWYVNDYPHKSSITPKNGGDKSGKTHPDNSDNGKKDKHDSAVAETSKTSTAKSDEKVDPA